MTTTKTIDISGLNKADLLAALYNNSRPMGMGFLQAREGEMTREIAEKCITGGDDSARRNGLIFGNCGMLQSLQFNSPRNNL